MAKERKIEDRDLEDSKNDRDKIMPDEGTIDLPEVKDIPGQENIVPPKMESFADTTISSDGEEGVGLLDEINEEDEYEGEIVIKDKNLEDDIYLPADDTEEFGEPEN